MSSALDSTAQSIGLYLHFPFCAYKCGYCDFNSWVEKDSEPQRQWLEGIKRELAFWKLQGGNFAVDTIFMGGGTPSLLAPALLQELCGYLKDNLDLSKNLEWTIEANPETISSELLENLEKCGVNRLSIGIQSFQDQYLKRLERGATAESNRRALGLVSQHWRKRWSLDLMFGLPMQGIGEWKADLEEALSFKSQHLSAYQLTLTTQKSKSWQQGTEGELLEFFRATREILAAQELKAYEISNFAVAGHESQHNLKYWKAQPFLGLGPGAYSLLPSWLLETQAEKYAWGAHLKTPSKLKEWLLWTLAPDLSLLEKRDEKMHINELLLLGLRLETGIEKAFFPSGIKWEKLQKIQHLIETSGDFIRASARGREILDTTILEASRLLV